MLKVGINGFGRIGRLVARAAFDRDDLAVVAVNDIGDYKTGAHLLKYDSVHGTWSKNVEVGDGFIKVEGREIKFFNEFDPANIPWDKAGVEVVVEATGKFTSRKGASAHLRSGVRKVLITAPGKGEVDYTIVMGVNHQGYDPDKHHVVSNASCTTNCLAPIAKVINDEFTIIRGFMTTIHSYTNDQRILDLEHKDVRRARSGALSMIPTTTGAAVALGLVIPELNGKMDGISIRVPTPNVSLVDLVVDVEESTTTEELNDALRRSSEGRMAGIIQYSELPLVSRDFNGNPHSAVVDGLSTMAVGSNMFKVIAWYDNEWGYSSRVVDAVSYIAACGI